MALNAKTENANGTGHRKWEENNDPERWDWDYDSGCLTETTALNAKRKMNSGSERQMESEQWLWTPNWREWCDNSKCRPKIVAMNAKLKRWLWTPKRNNGSERQTKLNNHERQVEKNDSERRN